MKKTFFILALIMVCLQLQAQHTQDVVYLKNGSVIKGDITELQPGQSLKVRTADGSIFAYDMSDVEKIEKEEAKQSPGAGKHRGLDFNIDLGWHFGTGGGSNVMSAELGLGKRFNKNFYWGIGSGVFKPTGDGDIQIPITSDIRLYFPLSSTSMTPGGIVRIGYVINTADDLTFRVGKKEYTQEIPDNIMVQVMPSLQFPISKTVDINIGAGYTHFFPTKGGSSSGAFSIKTGFAFHKSDKPKPRKPTRDSGMQFTIEGGNEGLGGDILGSFANLVFTYKLNPKWSFGIGFGYEFLDDYIIEEPGMYSYERTDGTSGEHYYSEAWLSAHIGKVFARGVYRFNDNKLSPIVACDAGLRFYGYDSTPYYDGLLYGTDKELDEPSTSLFLAPSVGLSLRTTNNSYLELKLGYTLTKISGKDMEFTKDGGRYDTTYKLSYEPINLSTPFVSLGFTHTFGWGEGWFK